MNYIKYKGNRIYFTPETDKVEILFITETDRISTKRSLDKYEKKPVFLFRYENSMYFGICDYIFGFLETTDDWEHSEGDTFRRFNPRIEEFTYLMNLNPELYTFNYEWSILKGNLDYFSEYELGIIKQAHRDIILSKI